MWKIFNETMSNNISDSYSSIEDALSNRSSENDLVLFVGKLPIEPVEIHAIEQTVKRVNNKYIRLQLGQNEVPPNASLEIEGYPSNCWCLARHCPLAPDPGRPDRPGRCFGTIECSYCNENGYCWIVDTGQFCSVPG